MVDAIKPPITAVAIGERNSPPSPMPKADGNMPAPMASVVMIMGLARLWPASTIASTRSMPCFTRSTAKSTSMMPFLATMPISINMPMTTGIESAWFVNNNAPTTPPIESGKANTMANGWKKLPNSNIKMPSMMTTPSKAALPKLEKISPCTSASPPAVNSTDFGKFNDAATSSNLFWPSPSSTPCCKSAPIFAQRCRS